MGVFEIQAPDGKLYEVEAPDMQTAASAFQPREKSAGQLPDLPSIYSQFPDMLENTTGAAATLGASDAQMTDIISKKLGDRFLRTESASRAMSPSGPGGKSQGTMEYPVIVYRGDDGTEKRAYVNKPGLDMEDVSRGIRGALPYMLSGGAAGAMTRGAGLLGQAAAQGVAGAGTSVAGDLAQIPMGSEQGVETGKAVGAGLMSMGVPLASRAAGNAAKAVTEYMTPQTGPLKGMSRKAVNNVADAMKADGNINRQSVAGVVSDYGDEVMLADMGNTLQSDAAALARTPVAKDVAGQAIMERQALAPARIRDTLDNEMGVQRNLPQYIEQGSARYNAQARPFYQQFEKTPILASSRLTEILARVPRSAYSEAEKLARADGLKQRFTLKPVNDPMAPMTGVQGTKAERIIQGREYDYLKRAIDDLAKKAEYGSNEFRIYSNLARDLRTEVDSILSPGNPSQSPWAQGRSIAGEGLEGRDAAELGSQAFGATAKDPHIVQSEMAGMSKYGQDMYREGARNKLRQVMGRSASNFGPKGDSAARRALNSEFSQDNLRQIVGDGSARRIGNRIEAENQFATLHDMARGNSITDTMQAARKRWAPHTNSDFASEAGKKGPAGMATEYVLRLADALIGGQMKKAELKAAVDGAKILTATGKERDLLVDALFKLMQDKKKGAITGQKFESMARALLEGAKAPAMQNQR